MPDDKPKVKDPIRYPKVQGSYEKIANAKYDAMLKSMQAMLKVALIHAMK